MAKRLKIQLLPNWAQQPNPNGPAAFYRKDSVKSGFLTISVQAEYRGGKIPDPTFEALVALAKGLGEQKGIGAAVDASSGSCLLGKFGTAVFRSQKHPRVQFWILSNGMDFLLAAHVCSIAPETVECDEAHKIVQLVGFSE